MFERFTPEARLVVVRAQQVVRERGDTKIGTAHLLLALCEEPATAQVLGEHDVRTQAVSERMAELGFGANPTVGPSSGHIPFTRNARRSLERGLRAVNREGAADIEPIHLLLGLAALPESTAGGILASRGLDAAAIRGKR